VQLTKHFHLNEFRCRDAHRTAVPLVLVAELTLFCATVLEPLRRGLDAGIHITSGYRTDEHNTSVGGAVRSYHVYTKRPAMFAVDFAARGWDPREVYGVCRYLMNNGTIVAGGLGLYNDWVHLDNRGYRATWRTVR
jgi:uncharacterized protein YcbK (DUF882 family)